MGCDAEPLQGVAVTSQLRATPAGQYNLKVQLDNALGDTAGAPY